MTIGRSPLLETKFHAPRPRASSVARPRLTARLDRGTESRLTLISAPAGFGKSTLVTEWLASAGTGGRRVAWLSLDPSDSDPATYWTYVVRALQTVAPEVGQTVLPLLQGMDRPTGVVVATLVNELSAVTSDVVLVLDDYHAIENLGIHEDMALLLERMPPQMHVVITTRADPALPLARLRARAELVEIRAADLRFTSDEAAAYLNGAMGLTLEASDVEALEGRTEGWIAALQLAAISLQGRSDTATFIAEFAGDDRYIVDYLAEEVLQRQTEAVRTFLLETSILARMTGSLCDAVTGRDDGRTALEALDRANLFLVPLDDRRQWYRYHHLFADVLQTRLQDERPGDLPDLHRRASAWFDRNGDWSEAIRHAMAGKDESRAADLIELAIPEMRKARQEMALLRWLRALPEEVFDVRPVLSAGYAGTLLSVGEVDGVERRLRAAERWLEAPKALADPAGERPTGMVVLDEAEFRRLPGAIALFRVGHARMTGDVPLTIELARRALQLVPEDDDVGRGGISALLALSYWTNGDLAAAYRSYAEGMASLERGGHLADVVGGSVVLTDLLIAQGRLDEAMRTYERALRFAGSEGGSPLRGAADMHVGMSGLFRERNDLATASHHLDLARELGDENGFPQNPYRWRVAAARIRQAVGDLDGAVTLLDEAEHVYFGDFSPDVRPVAAVRARVWIAQGRLSDASRWAREKGLTSTDVLSYLHEFEHATLVRLLLAQGLKDGAGAVIGEAIDLSGRLVAGADNGARIGSVVDALVVHALARHASDDTAGALSALGRAVELSKPERYVRIFLDEGQPMTVLLRLAAKQRDASPYIRTLLAVAVTSESPGPIEQPLIEPLSERELDVLRLLRSDLGGPDIARALGVSLSTVRTHTQTVYAKLGVNGRRAAVQRAEGLGLFSR